MKPFAFGKSFRKDFGPAKVMPFEGSRHVPARGQFGSAAVGRRNQGPIAAADDAGVVEAVTFQKLSAGRPGEADSRWGMMEALGGGPYAGRHA